MNDIGMNAEARMQHSGRWLRLMVIVLFALQPLMDIVSYWMQELGMSNAPTLALRFAVLGAVALLGFVLSERKRCYLIFAAACALLLLGHCAACLLAGYENPVTDLINFVRVIQMPLFTLSFITMLRREDGMQESFETGFLVCFWVISLSVLLSVLTGTYSFAYRVNGYGILGWFATSSAQSSIMSTLVPIAVTLALKKEKSFVLLITVAAGFLQLYFMGPRLAFLSIVMTAVGGILSMVLARRFSLVKAVALALALVVCLGCIRLSPMTLNRTVHTSEMAQKQMWESEMYEREKNAAEEDDTDSAEPAAEPDKEPAAAEQKQQDAEQAALRYIYEYYTPQLCERFGTDAVMEAYDYTQDVNTLMAERPKKIMFCKMLLEEHPFISKIFGMELSQMTWKDYVFDVENDFHGIFFLYGAAGLAMLLLFLGYFLLRIVLCLLHDFRRYFTLDAAAFGMALLMLLIYTYCTAGVLRRPNSSFYLSAVLAMIYSLTVDRMETEPESEVLEAK